MRGGGTITKLPARFAFLLVFLSLPSSLLGAAEIVFTRIANRDTLIPGGLPGATFVTFEAPVVQDGVVAFVGFGFSDWAGVYVWKDGVLEVVADVTTQVPGAPPGETFTVFEAAATDGTSVSVQVPGAAYTTMSGALRVVADGNTPVPGGQPGEIFGGVGRVTMGPGQVLFLGGGFLGSGGIYRDRGAGLEIVVDHTVEVPGRPGAFFAATDKTSTDGTLVSFSEGDGGIYQTSEAGMVLIADRTMELPGGLPGELFDRLGVNQPTSTSDGKLIFSAEGLFTQGIYGDLGGTLDVVVDTRGGQFISVHHGSLDRGRIVFEGTPLDQPIDGIYLKKPGFDSSPIIETGNPLDGRVVSSSILGEPAFSGRDVAIWVRFTDGTKGIYLATLPTKSVLEIPTASPGALVFLALALAAAGALLARRQDRVPKRS